MYRYGGVGVMAGQQVIHMAPPASRVPHLMRDLLGWLMKTKTHPLLASSVFHYEFEFIHPFADGNGRMGRLWQSLILSHWNPLFANMPVESLIFEHQAEYYRALQASSQSADAGPFISFMLHMIHAAMTLSKSSAPAPEVTPEATPEVTPKVTPEVTPEVIQEVVPELRLLMVITAEMKGQQIKEALGLRDDEHFRKAYLLPALAAGWIEMTHPDKPRSSKQRYRLTQEGLQQRTLTQELR